MLSIKPILVGRAVVDPGPSEPVQCSENSQVAINNTDHITILDPTIPSLHNFIQTPANGSSQKRAVDLNRFYAVSSVLNIADLESLGLQIVSRVLIKDGEDKFSFGRIAEPAISSIEWSKLDERTRDCYLGVLLNTGEALVLRRTTQDAGQYAVLYRSFTCILHQMSLPQNRLTEEQNLVLTNAEYQELQITSFAFCKAANGEIHISLTHQNGHLTVHRLSDGLDTIARIDVGGSIVSQVWSEDNATLALLKSDNSVVTFAFDETLSVRDASVLVKEPSRFLVSKVKFVASNILVITDTRRLYVLNSGNAMQVDLPHQTLVVGLSSFESGSNQILLISHATGKLVLVSISKTGCSIIPTPSSWSLFLNRTILQFQHAWQNEQNRAPSEAFKPLLNDKIDAKFHLYGTELCANGYLALVFNVVPKNVIHHETRSKAEFQVTLLPLSDLHPSVHLTYPTGNSIAAVQRSLLQNIESFPITPSMVNAGGDDSLISYLDNLLQWKNTNFASPHDLVFSYTERGSLSEALSLDFRKNSAINGLQKLFVFNLHILEALTALKSKSSSEALQSALASINEEQTTIRTKISNHLTRLVLRNVGSTFNSDVDKYIQLTFLKLLPEGEEVPISLEEATFVDSTDLFTEKFHISRSDDRYENFSQFALSESSHTWRRCDLTLLPIMSVSHRIDESGEFVYANLENTSSSSVAETLHRELDYCIYTCTRIYELKVGL